MPRSFQYAQEMQWVINLFYTLLSKCKQLPIIMQEESLKQTYSITASETAGTFILSSSNFKDSGCVRVTTFQSSLPHFSA
jgi:hypothetical protein